MRKNSPTLPTTSGLGNLLAMIGMSTWDGPISQTLALELLYSHGTVLVGFRRVKPAIAAMTSHGNVGGKRGRQGRVKEKKAGFKLRPVVANN